METSINYKGQILEVGTPLTQRCCSDKNAGRISKIISPKKIEIELVRDDGVIWSKEIWTLRRNGEWAEEHNSCKYWLYLIFGEAINDWDLSI